MASETATRRVGAGRERGPSPIERGQLDHGILATARAEGQATCVGRFHHESLFYSGEEEFMSGATAFLREGIEREEPALVVVGARRIGMLREALGDAAELVRFEDMRVLGANPARIIPVWREFLEQRGGRGTGARGIGEPVWPGRDEAELAECRLHESLLNTAFDGGEDWRLLCPYDRENLGEAVLEAARRTHPHVSGAGWSEPSEAYEPHGDPFAGSLAHPTGEPLELSFTAAELSLLRDTVRAASGAAELLGERAEDLLLAVSELAANSILHGGGGGRLRIWTDGNALLCEVSDAGHITDPLVGRVRPRAGQPGGRGLWLVNQVCDLAQIRSSAAAGSTIRLHMRLS